MESIYYLNNKYYQKLGEVWDHEIKDFKVLYKLLYNCPSTLLTNSLDSLNSSSSSDNNNNNVNNNSFPSYETHHLAVTSFERWERRFIPIKQLEKDHILPDYINSYLLNQTTLNELTKGNDSLPIQTKPMPKIVQNCSIVGQVTLNEIKTHPYNSNLKISRSMSGYGSRSLLPYYVMDFDIKWREPILQRNKTATTRIISSNIEGGEPYLQEIIDKFFSLTSNESLIVQAVCDVDEESNNSNLSEVIGKIQITQIKEYSVKDLPLELANIELFDTLESFLICLRGYYPTLSENDIVTVFYFQLVE